MVLMVIWQRWPGIGLEEEGGWIEEREEEAVVSQETHPKVDHQPKAARTRCQRWWHRHRHFQTEIPYFLIIISPGVAGLEPKCM